VLGYGALDLDIIPANSPLKFIIMLIDPVEIPEPSEELVELYAKY
jgi:hypothetical protein